MTPESETKPAPAAKVVTEYRPKHSCKKCGGRGINGYHTKLVVTPTGKEWQRQGPARCSCCKPVRVETVEMPGGEVAVTQTPAVP
ncbi:MAG: hypothetical protein PHX83_06990 [Acidobacteriia bacterium]|nr:hypothetical protein [Terriglobia bacterium]